MDEKAIAFRDMCRKHDLTYEYTDSPRVFSLGIASWMKLRKFAAENLDEVQANHIWNSVVDEKISKENVREEFYWG